MKKSAKWIYMVIGGFLAITLLAGAGLLYLRSEAAELARAANLPMKPYSLAAGWFGDGDTPFGKYEEALAEALGIPVEELQSAHEAVWESAIEAAVSDGKLTEEQAGQILERDGI